MRDAENPEGQGGDTPAQASTDDVIPTRVDAGAGGTRRKLPGSTMLLRVAGLLSFGAAGAVWWASRHHQTLDPKLRKRS